MNEAKNGRSTLDPAEDELRLRAALRRQSSEAKLLDKDCIGCNWIRRERGEEHMPAECIKCVPPRPIKHISPPIASHTAYSTHRANGLAIGIGPVLGSELHNALPTGAVIIAPSQPSDPKRPVVFEVAVRETNATRWAVVSSRAEAMDFVQRHLTHLDIDIKKDKSE